MMIVKHTTFLSEKRKGKQLEDTGVDGLVFFVEFSR
jgi:hypothetical protein